MYTPCELGMLFKLNLFIKSESTLFRYRSTSSMLLLHLISSNEDKCLKTSYVVSTSALEL